MVGGGARGVEYEKEGAERGREEVWDNEQKKCLGERD